MAIRKRILQSSKNPSPSFTRRLLPTLIGTAFLLPQAHAYEFTFGEIEGQITSQVSVGASWRLDDASSNLISVPNGGTSNGSGSYDDANLNFEQGETFSEIVKGFHDLDLLYKNMGLFVRVKYWYDNELENGSRDHGHLANGYQPGDELRDNDFNNFAKFSGFELLDAFWYGNFDIGDRPLDIRLGRQVINWGESTFIQGGLNSINPVDVSAFRRPGAEVKEGLLPLNMAFVSFGINDNLSVEGFYQFKWEPTAIDGCGTYFSTTDFVAEGCDGIRIPLPLTDQQYFDPAISTAVLGYDPSIVRNENGRREPDDENQFGIAARYFAENLNDTEFGFYYAKYHSRLPLLNAVNTNSDAGTFLNTFAGTVIALGGNPLAPTPEQVQAATVASIGTLVDTTYFTSYSEDIELIGVSFNTNVGDVAWSGEVSHKKDVPLQINGPLLVAAILNQYSGGSGNAAADALVAQAGTGGTIQGFEKFDVTQVQSSLIKFYDRVLGASRLALIGEFAWTHVHSFDESVDAFKFGRNGAFGFAAGDNDGFVTEDSYGYVLRAALDYPNAFAGVSLSPQISFRHGLEGYGVQPGSAFNEDEKVLGVSLTGEYLSKYLVQLSYTSYSGGDFNALEDRDFISLSASVSF